MTERAATRLHPARIRAIALNTFREAARSRILYAILLLVVAVNFAAIGCGVMSYNEEARVAVDFGLASVGVFGALTAIVLGVTLLYTEVQRRTIHVILAKPILRHEFVLGKYVGMAMTLTFLVVAFGLALLGQLALQGAPVTAALGMAVILAWLEVMIVAAIAIFFSALSSPFLSGLFTLGLWAIGRSSDELARVAEKFKIEAFRWVAKAALYVVPDLHVYSVSGSELQGQWVSVHGTFVTWGYVGSAALYAAAVVAILLILAMVVFARRDFT
jgi:ABC-type transport system involved in multi-copper enzyme maturation permease subunit